MSRVNILNKGKRESTVRGASEPSRMEGVHKRKVFTSNAAGFVALVIVGSQPVCFHVLIYWLKKTIRRKFGHMSVAICFW